MQFINTLPRGASRISKVNLSLQTAAVSGLLVRLSTNIAAALLLGLFLTQPVLASGPLDRRALAALFPGEFEAVVHGYQVNFTAHRNGALVGRYAFATDSGRWSIRRGQLCITLDSWLDGRTACSRVVRQGHWYRANDVLFRRP